MTYPTQNNILTYSLCSSNLEVRTFGILITAFSITSLYFLHLFYIMLGVSSKVTSSRSTVYGFQSSQHQSFFGVFGNLLHRYIMTNFIDKGVNPSKNSTNLTPKEKELYLHIYARVILRKFRLPFPVIKAILFLILTPLLILSCKPEEKPCKRLKKAPSEVIQGDDISHITKNIARGNK